MFFAYVTDLATNLIKIFLVFIYFSKNVFTKISESI